MSAIPLILLVTALVAGGVSVCLGAAALYAARGLRTEVAALRAGLDRTVPGPPVLPAPRPAPGAEEIRIAVAEALAEERERELAEARAFWADQDARQLRGTGAYDAAEDDDALLDALLEEYLTSEQDPDASGDRDPRDSSVFVPRQQGPLRDTDDSADDGESAELAAARRRHPSHPGFTLSGTPADRPGAPDMATAEEVRRVTEQLSRLAEARTPLADVRPGPLGTLDVYLFADGTTVCLTPGHHRTAERLAEAVRDGTPPVLLGGSGVSGGYALTFSCGSDSLYLLADRVVTSL
ncbi:hypothetical protein GCM10009716_25590 [Streptomyces sodiiphilus]|uniref:Secreted protein n=1 Tax=Streptomyces sodiiphilus TaxID=226217 RepID=A0ABN2P835_9ACTN